MYRTAIIAAGYTVEPLVDVEGTFFPLHVVFPAVATPEWEPFRAWYPDTFSGSDMLYTRVTCYLIRGHRRTILVDCGVGPGPASLFGNARGRLLKELADRGVTPDSIDIVVLTHLHPDHIGWAAHENRPVFPRARYVVSRADLETFHQDEVRTAMQSIVPGYLDECLTPLEEAGVLDTVVDTTELAPSLTVVPSPGHTPGMLRVELDDGTTRLWLVADVFTHPAQAARTEWCSAFDMIPELAIATRKAIVERATVEGIQILASHFPPVPGRLHQDGASIRWEPVSH
ncbi:N-acyl homoserine lactonase [bacterium HR28]|nr:N-acyl homoserine lactonase [bacterium HR28]